VKRTLEIGHEIDVFAFVRVEIQRQKMVMLQGQVVEKNGNINGPEWLAFRPSDLPLVVTRDKD